MTARCDPSSFMAHLTSSLLCFYPPSPVECRIPTVSTAQHPRSLCHTSISAASQTSINQKISHQLKASPQPQNITLLFGCRENPMHNRNHLSCSCVSASLMMQRSLSFHETVRPTHSCHPICNCPKTRKVQCLKPSSTSGAQRWSPLDPRVQNFPLSYFAFCTRPTFFSLNKPSATRTFRILVNSSHPLISVCIAELVPIGGVLCTLRTTSPCQ